MKTSVNVKIQRKTSTFDVLGL